MSAHAFFSPSKAEMWITCAGAMSFKENQQEGRQSDFADEGTAAHHFAALALKNGVDADCCIGGVTIVNNKNWVCTPDMAEGIQVYLDDVRRRVGSGMLFVEQRVDLQPWLGHDQFGTADVIIVDPENRRITVEDLKFGRGEKVTAEGNKQAQLYALGALVFAELFADVDDTWTTELVISQPRVNREPSVWLINVGELRAFGETASAAVEKAQFWLSKPFEQHEQSLTPSEKGCRWCAAKAICPALTKKVFAETQAEFDVIHDEVILTPPQLPRSNEQLANAYAVVPLIQNWIRAVESMVYEKVAAGEGVRGSDGYPLKMVEGRQGSRQWIDTVEAEAVLAGTDLGEKMYEPRKVITASVAAKLLDKGKNKDMWKEYFVPLIKRSAGKPVLALGTDERPAYVGDVTAEFTEIQPED